MDAPIFTPEEAEVLIMKRVNSQLPEGIGVWPILEFTEEGVTADTIDKIVEHLVRHGKEVARLSAKN